MAALEIWVMKLIAGALLFVVSLAFGLSPLFCLRRFLTHDAHHGKAKAALGFASCVAAGVFLAVCLLDLLPDVQESLSRGFTTLGIHMPFPMAELVMALGLFFILSIELVVSMCNPDLTEMMHSHGPGDNSHSHRHGHGHGHSHVTPPHHHHNNHDHNHHDHEPLLIKPRRALSADDEGEDDDEAQLLGSTPSQQRRRNSSENERSVALLGTSASSPQLMPTVRSSVAFDSASVVVVTRTPSIQSLPAIYLAQPPTLREEVEEAGLSVFDRPFRAIILLVALSIHSLFEGLSIGAAQSADVVVQLTLALAIHKPMESLGVCLSLLRGSKTQSLVVKLVVFFSITCPLGVGLGAGVLGLLSSGISDLVTGILQGLASGSFLYVVFVEVLPHEFVEVLEEPQQHPEMGGAVDRTMTPSTARKVVKRIRTLRMLKLLGLLLGFTVITMSVLFLPEDTDESPHPC